MKTRLIRIPMAAMKIRASGSFWREDGRASSDVGSVVPANPV